ncbi:MAG: hypothetical protein U9O78_00035 [Patescibacteria group bacterium]|nr:hypothetical protein [Patescibacteria group bacterium]
MKLWNQLIDSIKLSRSQLKVLQGVFKEIGLVFLAGWIIGPIATTNLNLSLMISGIILTLISWCAMMEITNYLDTQNG